MKEKLAREHRLLVFQNVDKRGQTVSLLGALSRLLDGCEVPLSPDDVKTIKSAAEWRNQIVHSQFSLNTAELKAAFANLTGFIADFHGRFLDDNLEGVIPKELWQKAVSIRDYGEALFRRANDRLAREKIHPSNVLACLTCGRKAFVIQNNVNRCYVCGHAEDVVRCDGCGFLEYASQMSIEPESEPGSPEVDYICRACLSSPDYWAS